MIIQRPSSSRGQTKTDRLDSRHGFSFGGYYDPAWMGFGPLRVLNEDHLAPGAAFDAQRRANMELLTYVVDGELVHRDSLGGENAVRAGELQWLSAGHGVEHTESNASDATPAHVLRIWIQPSRLNHEPAYARHPAADPDARGWVVRAAGDGRANSLPIRQDVRVSQVRLARGATAEYALDASRLYWLHLVSGRATANGEHVLEAGDALGWQDEDGTLALQGGSDEPALALLFDLPE